jgi:hypothetical protein
MENKPSIPKEIQNKIEAEMLNVTNRSIKKGWDDGTSTNYGLRFAEGAERIAKQEAIGFGNFIGEGFELLANGDGWTLFAEKYCEIGAEFDKIYTTDQLYTLYQQQKQK